MNHKDVWDGVYRDVSYEVVHWRLGWNYYIYLPLAQIPDEAKHWFMLRRKPSDFGGKKRYFYDYGDAHIIADLDWHGGITLFEKQIDEDGVQGYKLGCDYMHLWDEGHTYDFQVVDMEAKVSIDKLWKLVPNLKVRCAWNGEYYPIEDTYLTDKGVRVAIENKEAWEKPFTLSARAEGKE